MKLRGSKMFREYTELALQILGADATCDRAVSSRRCS